MINTRKDMKKLIQGGGANFELLKEFCKSHNVKKGLACISYCSLLLAPPSKDCFVTISCVTEHQIVVTWAKNGNCLEAILRSGAKCELAYNGEIIFTGYEDQCLLKIYKHLLILGVQVTSALKHIECRNCRDAFAVMFCYSEQCVNSWIQGIISNEVLMQGVLFCYLSLFNGHITVNEQSHLVYANCNCSSEKALFFEVSEAGCILMIDYEVVLQDTSIEEALGYLKDVGYNPAFREQYMLGYPDNLLQPEDLADVEDQTTFFSAP